MDLGFKIWNSRLPQRLGPTFHPWAALGGLNLWQHLAAALDHGVGTSEVAVDPKDDAVRISLPPPPFGHMESYVVFFRGDTAEVRRRTLTKAVELGPLSPHAVPFHRTVNLEGLLKAAEIAAPHGVGVALTAAVTTLRTSANQPLHTIVQRHPFRFAFRRMGVRMEVRVGQTNIFDCSDLGDAKCLPSIDRALDVAKRTSQQGVAVRPAEVIVVTASEPALDVDAAALQHPVARNIFAVVYYDRRFEMVPYPVVCENVRVRMVQPFLETALYPQTWDSLEETMGWSLIPKLPPLRVLMRDYVFEFGDHFFPSTPAHWRNTLLPKMTKMRQAGKSLHETFEELRRQCPLIQSGSKVPPFDASLHRDALRRISSLV